MSSDRLDRRQFLGCAAAGAAMALAPSVRRGGRAAPGPSASPVSDAAPPDPPAAPAPHAWIEEATIATLSAAMASGKHSAKEIAEAYLARIEALDGAGPSCAPSSRSTRTRWPIADALDAERRGARAARPAARHPDPAQGQHRHRRPDDHDRRLAGAGRLDPARDAVRRRPAARGRRRPARQGEPERVGQLPLDALARAAGARAAGRAATRTRSTAARAARAPARARRSPPTCAPVAIGTETDGSIVCPASASGIVGIKPTVGLTSRAGIIPIAHSQDTAGPMARTVADAAAPAGALAGVDDRDPATRRRATAADYARSWTRRPARRAHRRGPRSLLRLPPGGSTARRGGDRGDARARRRPSSIRPTSRTSTEMDDGRARRAALRVQGRPRSLPGRRSARRADPHAGRRDRLQRASTPTEEMPFFGQELFLRRRRRAR